MPKRVLFVFILLPWNHCASCSLDCSSFKNFLFFNFVDGYIHERNKRTKVSKRALYVLNLMKPLSQLKPGLVRWLSTKFFFFYQRHTKETRGPKVLKRCCLFLYVDRLFFNQSFIVFLIEIFCMALTVSKIKGGQHPQFRIFISSPIPYEICCLRVFQPDWPSSRGFRKILVWCMATNLL